MMDEYLIAFSSFYKAVYAQEMLMENRIRATLKKVPTSLMMSCGYALYLSGSSINAAMAALARNKIDIKGLYLIESRNGQTIYRAM